MGIPFYPLSYSIEHIRNGSNVWEKRVLHRKSGIAARSFSLFYCINDEERNSHIEMDKNLIKYLEKCFHVCLNAKWNVYVHIKTLMYYKFLIKYLHWNLFRSWCVYCRERERDQGALDV